jgi:hypothetical protein
MKTTAAVLIMTLGLLMAGCTSIPTPADQPVSAPIVADRISGDAFELQPLDVAVFGDSITSWSPPYAGDPAQSWVTAATSNEMPLVCGWARPGATLGQMASAAVPCDAFFLVIMGGTNDLYGGVPSADRLAAIDLIAATVESREVVLMAVAPYGFDWAAGAVWNAELAQHASQRGWRFLDPWKDLRTADDAWVPGADRGDGIHPSPVTAAAAGAVIREALEAWHAA